MKNIPKMKAQSILLGHAFIVGMGVILVLVVAASMKAATDDNREFVGTKEITQVCSIMKSSFEKMLFQQDYISPTNTTAGRVTASLPEKIADMRYRTRLSGDEIIVETQGAVLVNHTCKIGFNASYAGSTAGGQTVFELTRYSNGTKEIRISNG